MEHKYKTWVFDSEWGSAVLRIAEIEDVFVLFIGSVTDIIGCCCCSQV